MCSANTPVTLAPMTIPQAMIMMDMMMMMELNTSTIQISTIQMMIPMVIQLMMTTTPRIEIQAAVT